MGIVDLGKLEAIVLSGGSHTRNEQDMCIMEATAYIAGEAWSDHPACASPTLTGFAIVWNDALAACSMRDELQQLKAFVPRLIGTAGDLPRDIRRAEMAAAWAREVAVPAWQVYAAKYAAKSAAKYAAESAEYAKSAAKYAAESAKSAAKYAAEYAAKYAEYAAESAKYAAESAEYAAESAKYAAKSAAEYAAEYAAESAKYAARTKAVFMALHPQMCVLFDRMIEAE